MAEKEGVQGVSVITPYYVSPSQPEIIDHYRRIAESTSLPMLLYNNPVDHGGVKIDVDSVVELAGIANIVGIKDSSGDLQTTNEMIRAVPELQRADRPGNADLRCPDLVRRGSVPAAANIAPQLAVEIYEAFRRGDHAAAKAAQPHSTRSG